MNDLKENQKKKFPDFLHFWFILGVVAIVPLLITLIDQDVGNFGNVFTIIIIQGNLAMIFFAIVSMVLLLTKKSILS